MTRVTVVGGGIAGLCAAYYLNRAGAEVEVLETRRVGSGASRGNAGWISPAQAGPLPEPGLIGYGVRSLADPGSALYLDPRRLARMLPWLVGFARRCNESDHAEGRLALGRLAERSFELLDAMAADGVAVELRRLPLLVAAQDPEHGHTFLERLEPLARLGFTVPPAVLARRRAAASRRHDGVHRSERASRPPADRLDGDWCAQMIDGWRAPDADTVWSGRRPIAPDGLPIVDRHPRLGNVFLADRFRT